MIYINNDNDNDNDNDWDKLLLSEVQKPYFKVLSDFLEEEYLKHTVYPPSDELFTALKLTPYREVKVVILGQDPYHQKGQAHGLAFSVKEGCRLPPSLRNIYKEIASETGGAVPQGGDLTRWARQGVLLLNAVLTVREGEPRSHHSKGWERFTDQIISILNEREAPIVFLLWGADACKKLPLITNKAHHCLTSAHPSPLSASRGFFGCGHFAKANEHLGEEILWD